MLRQNRTRSTDSNEPGSSTVLDACAVGRGSLRGDEREAVSNMKGEKRQTMNGTAGGVGEWIYAPAAQSPGASPASR